MEVQPTYFRFDVVGMDRYALSVGTGWRAQYIPVLHRKDEGNAAQRMIKLISHLLHLNLAQNVFRHALQVLLTR